MLRLDAISKSFGGVAALRGVSLNVKAGTVHGLLGENGAGKSTLMNVLFGLVRPDAGRIFLGETEKDATEIVLHSPRDAQRHGIGMVHQHFKLSPSLTVLENLCLARQHGLGWIKRRAMRRELSRWTETLGWQLDGDRRIGTLSVGEQQRVEIVRALLAGGMEGGGILILDEPTAVLTPQEIRELFPAIRRLTRGELTGGPGKSASATAIIFISHKLAEVEALCDEVTILRQGRVVHSGPAKAISLADMAEKMIGAKVELPHLERTEAGRAASAAPAILQLQNAGMTETAGRMAIRDVSFAVRSGEIVGIAGVDGNGQSELVRLIVGTLLLSKGELRLDGQRANRWTVRRRMETMAYVPGDRHTEAVALPLDLVQNMMMKEYRAPRFSTMGWLRLGRWRMHTTQLMYTFDVRHGAPTDALGTLSGGNQQKLVLARELHGGKRLVIAVNPTRGLDVGATAFVMRQLLAARAGGAGVLLIHSDLDELLAISDRVLVLYNGTLRESAWPHATKESIGRLMLGVAASEPS